MGTGFFAPRAQAVVCWNQEVGGTVRTVGLRLLADGRAARAWKAMVAQVARSGARPA
jgi:hypothetical protein